jgi:chromosome partitioning protein
MCLSSGISKSINKSKMPLDMCTIRIFDGGSKRGKLDLLPSTLQLIDIETSRRGTESKLKAYLNEKASQYDYVIIDCPPTISIFTQAAMLASDKYIVPIKPDPLSVLGLPLLERWLDEFTEDNGLDLEAIGLVYTAVRGPQPRRMKEIMAEMRKERKRAVFTNYLRVCPERSCRIA